MASLQDLLDGTAMTPPTSPLAGPSLGEIGRPTKQGAYFTNRPGPLMFAFNPSLRSVNQDVLAAWRVAAARSIESIQNSGWLQGAVDALVAGTIGVQLKLNVQPDFETLGWSPEASAIFAKTVERRFEQFSTNPYMCDAAGRMTRGEMEAAIFKSWIAYGEAIAMYRSGPRPGIENLGRFQLLSPMQISQRSDKQKNIVQGVQLDDLGMPTAMLIEFETSTGQADLQVIPIRDNEGRELMHHNFVGQVGQVRGITPLAPALKVIRQYDQLADATLTATLLQTIFAATIKSQFPTEDALTSLQSVDEQADFRGLQDASADWYENTQIDLGTHGRIAHLFPNDVLEFHGSEHPSNNYESFHKGLLREISRCLGLTYEDMSGDYSNATYSSVRMATYLNWGVAVLRRKHIIAKFSQCMYEAWLEEEILTNRIEFPGSPTDLTEFREAVFATEWRGPPRPTADELKTAKAYQALYELQVMSRDQICAEYGYDVTDVDEALAREAENRASLGLDPVPFSKNAAADTAEDAPDDAEDPPAPAKTEPKQSGGVKNGG